ncbi:MAG: restriction endonuclease subunit S [Oscillospiraceae bacterium]|nr:restriction endonuclease subunit S [Oscillospiraceae bacterium]
MSIKARLGDYIQEYSVRNRAEEDIPVYSVTNTQGFCKDYFGKEVASKDKSTYKIVPKGCFAYNPSRINVGSVDWQRYEDRVIVSPLYNVFSVVPQLDQQYLYYYLKSDFALQRIRAVATGSVRDNLKLAMLYEFPINLPSMETQKEIVEKLDGVKRVISLRGQEMQTLDDLIKARFVTEPILP